MLLIGSKALQHYIPDLGRITHDWDILMCKEEYDTFLFFNSENLIKATEHSSLFEIGGEIVEVKDESRFDPTDFALEVQKCNRTTVVDTPAGRAFVPTLAFLYDIKWATALVIEEPKHFYDLELMEKKFGFGREYRSEFFKKRLAEAQVRVSKSKKNKYDFFHKYKIPEYIYHDELHEMIADLLDINVPTYVRTINGDVETEAGLYNKLTHAQKVSIMVEESLVLSLERWFIPQMVENGINHQLVDMFYDNNEGLPTYKILKHVNITGLKGEAEYVTQFGRDNFFEIEKEWRAAKEKIRSKGGFPKQFFQRLFDLRAQYKKGVQIDKGIKA